MLQRSGGDVLRRCVVVPFGRAEYAERFIRHSFVGVEDFRANVVRQRQSLAVFPVGCALFEHLVRRSLGVLHHSALCAMDGGHHLAHAVERRFGNARFRRFQFGFRQTLFKRVVDQRVFGRLADDRALVVRLGIAAERERFG
ncbi:hypothetical protein SDC9_121957 [bioreactor metagenome]|uniref:Uncharacterized protein n=1 Tax=bioreactor metagenome TaxID=1076179 RepID=A0A645CDJ1_9ZZZZ